MKRKILLMVSCVLQCCLLSCGQGNGGCSISIEPLPLTKKTNVILSRLDLEKGGVWSKVDSVAPREKVFTWPKAYSHPFIGRFSIEDADHHVLGVSNEFIFSNAQLEMVFNPEVQPINYKRFVNALTFKVQGGENALYDDKAFLPAPTFLSARYLQRIKSEYQPDFETSDFAALLDKYEAQIIEAVKEHRGYYYTLTRLTTIKGFLRLSLVEKSFNLLSDDLKNTAEGKSIEDFIKISKSLMPGQTLPAFFLSTNKGETLPSSSVFKDKFYFLDFWGSGCAPCRTEMRDMKPMYQRLDTAKAQIVSISIDDNAALWKAASKEVGFDWLSFIKTADKETPIERTFALQYIPQNILINPSGTIVQRNVSLKELDDFMREQKLFKPVADIQVNR